MKQKDLVIGGEYLANSNNDYLNSGWDEKRIRVVDTEVSWYA